MALFGQQYILCISQIRLISANEKQRNTKNAFKKGWKFELINWVQMLNRQHKCIDHDIFLY